MLKLMVFFNEINELKQVCPLQKIRFYNGQRIYFKKMHPL